MKNWLRKRLLYWAARVVHNNGFVVCEIRNVGGTNYIVDAQGSMHKIGGKK